MSGSPERLRVVVVSGLSGGGKASVLRALEDIGYEAVDNPPLNMLEDMVTRSGQGLAICVDTRTRGFDASLVLQTLGRLRASPGLRVELVYAWADTPTLLRRYTETRRRHPLAPQGRVIDGIVKEQAIIGPLHEAADLVIDTSELPLASLRQLIERHFAGHAGPPSRLVLSLVSFAYPGGLPPDADLVFDARFLRNPHYDPILRSRTGLDAEVGAYIEADPDFGSFFVRIAELIDMLLPRFVQEGKKYATITIGCTGGRHRSVHLVEKLAGHLAANSAAAGADLGWRVHVTHRELAREGQEVYPTKRPVQRPDGGHDEELRSSSVQAQEA